MVVSWLVLPVVLLAASAGCGLAVQRLAGGGIDRLLVLPVGFATSIVIASQLTASGSTARLTTPVVLAVGLAGFLVAEDRWAWVPGRWAAGAALGVYLAFGAPVLLTGSPTFTGYIQLDDIATWLALTDQALSHGRDLHGLGASSYLATLQNYVGTGYPLGAFLPLGLGHELTLGRDIAWLFAPTMALTAALLCLTLNAIVAPVVRRAPARAAVAFVAAQPALLYGYVEWGAIKEITAALLVALVAALSPALGGPLRRLLPLALAIAAIVAALSVGGGVWVAPVLLAALVAARTHPRRLLVGVPVLVVAVAALSVPSLEFVRTFVLPQTKSGSTLTAATELGNLSGPLPFGHLFGIWPAGDFRMQPDQHGLTQVLLLLVALGGALGLGVAVHRGAGALAGYLVGAFVACLLLISRGSPWVDGKAMATASPIVLTAGLAALAWFASEHGRGLVRRLALAAFGVLAAGVLWSNMLSYGASYPAPHEQLAELASAGTLLAGQGPTLMTEYEPYGARHFLRKADGESASELRVRLIPLRDGTQLPKSTSADVLAFDPTALREYRSLVLRTSPLTSRPPSAYSLLRAGTSYDVWQRPASPPAQPVADLPLGTDVDPGAQPKCASVRGLAEQAGRGGRLVAVERQRPVVSLLASAALSGELEPNADPKAITPMGPGSLVAEVTVPRATRWAVWLGGSTRGRTTVTVDGRETGSVRGRLNNHGGMMRFGHVFLTRGTHRVVLRYDDGGLAPGEHGQRSLGLPLGPLVLAPPEGPLRPFAVPVRQATSLCGRHLDWIEAQAAS